MAKEGNPWTIKKKKSAQGKWLRKQNIFLTASAKYIIKSFKPLIPIISTLRKSSKLK